MSEFRCPFYYWDGANWRCAKISDYLSGYDFDTYCTSKSRYVECEYYKR